MAEKINDIAEKIFEALKKKQLNEYFQNEWQKVPMTTYQRFADKIANKMPSLFLWKMSKQLPINYRVDF